MLIYRVECGVHGPYIVQDGSLIELIELANEISDEHVGDPQRPVPANDGMYRFEYIDKSFGFVSRAQLKNWFDGWLCDLEDVGHRVSVYKVDKEHVVFGELQCAFDKEYAKLLKTYSLSKI